MQRTHWMILSLAGALAFAAGCGQQAAPTGEASGSNTAGSDKPAVAASTTPAPSPSASPAATASAAPSPTAAPAATAAPAPTQTPAQSPPEPAKPAPSAQPTASASPAPAPASTAKPAAEPAVTVVDDSKALQLFKDNCMVCHGENLEGGGGPNLQKVGGKRTKDEIMSKINKGGRVMPAFESELEKADVETLAAWLAAKK
jgi:mono/diheme cytochrome c family protein